jgi:hypothetical protein
MEKEVDSFRSTRSLPNSTIPMAALRSDQGRRLRGAMSTLGPSEAARAEVVLSSLAEGFLILSSPFRGVAPKLVRSRAVFGLLGALAGRAL